MQNTKVLHIAFDFEHTVAIKYIKLWTRTSSTQIKITLWCKLTGGCLFVI